MQLKFLKFYLFVQYLTLVLGFFVGGTAALFLIIIIAAFCGIPYSGLLEAFGIICFIFIPIIGVYLLCLVSVLKYNWGDKKTDKWQRIDALG